MKRSFSRKPKYGQWDIVERRGKEFEVATILGQGAYGTVYVVTDTEGRPFSLKHYDRYPNFEHLKPLKKRLREKIRAMIIDRVVCGKMEHIIGLADDQLIKMALLQEYVEGEHLFRRDSQGQHVYSRPHPPSRRFSSAIVTARDGVSSSMECKEKGVLHRDLKTSNLLLENGKLIKKMLSPKKLDGPLTSEQIREELDKVRLKILDLDLFGKLDRIASTDRWRVEGTNGFSPPERQPCETNPELSVLHPNSDQFGISVVLAELLEGNKLGPYNDMSFKREVEAHGLIGMWEPDKSKAKCKAELEEEGKLNVKALEPDIDALYELTERTGQRNPANRISSWDDYDEICEDSPLLRRYAA